MNLPVDISQVVLETPRLRMRAWKYSDLNDFYEYARVEGVGEMAGWPHHESKLMSLNILKKFIEEQKVLAIVNKENNKVIGSLGIEEYDPKQVDASFKPLACREIGYVLNKDYWGKGIMPEAVHEVLRYCFEDLQLDAVFCAHFSSNSQSKRVIEKSHFTYLKNIQHETIMGTCEDTQLYVLKKEEFK